MVAHMGRSARMSTKENPVPKVTAVHAFPIGPDVEVNTRPARPVRPNLKSFLWQTGPAWIDMHRKVDLMIAQNAKDRGLELSQVERIRVARKKNETVVYIFATRSDDEDGIEVGRFKSKTYANLADFMVPRGLDVPSGQARRFDVVVAGEESPVGPALKFDTAKPLETKTVKRRKTDEEIAEAMAVAEARAKARAEARVRAEILAKAKAEARTAARAATREGETAS